LKGSFAHKSRPESPTAEAETIPEEISTRVRVFAAKFVTKAKVPSGDTSTVPKEAGEGRVMAPKSVSLAISSTDRSVPLISVIKAVDPSGVIAIHITSGRKADLSGVSIGGAVGYKF